jgi:hypothetical protein
MATDPITFAIILDQYNRELAFVRDIGQKLNVAQLTYIGLFFAYKPFARAQLTGRSWAIPAYAVVAACVVGLYVTSYQHLYAIRMALSTFPGVPSEVAAGDLSRLGILATEPGLTIVGWALPFLLVDLIFVVAVFFVCKSQLEEWLAPTSDTKR